MDKKSKLIIVVLIVIGVVFALGLGTNLIHEEGEPKGEERKDKEKVNEYVEGYDKGGWIAFMDSLFGSFSPRLDARRLQGPAPGSQCRLDQGVLELFANSTDCVLKIRSRLLDCDDDYESTTLKLAEDDAATRGAPARIKLNPALMQAQPISRPKLKMADSSAKKPVVPELLVEYTPDGKDKASVGERNDEFRLVVSEQGGTLTIRCASCSRNRPARVSLATRVSCDD